MGSTFQIPNIFNFRLRQAKTPFEAAITPRPVSTRNPWDVTGPTFEENSWQPEQQQSQLPDFSMAMPDYDKLYGETGPATRRYQQHLAQAPDMQDYAPSKWRRFGAIISGIGAGLSGGNGYETARNVIMDPYKTAYENWMGRGQGAKEAATLEEAAANRKATIYQKILSDYMDQQRWKADYEIRWANAKTQAERNKIISDFNKVREGYQNRMLELTGARNRDTATYHASSLANQARGLDIQEQGMFHDSIQRALDRRSREQVATGEGKVQNVSVIEQNRAEDAAMEEIVAQMKADGTFDTYFEESQDAITRIKSLTGTKYEKLFNDLVAQKLKIASGGKRF